MLGLMFDRNRTVGLRGVFYTLQKTLWHFNTESKEDSLGINLTLRRVRIIIVAGCVFL